MFCSGERIITYFLVIVPLSTLALPQKTLNKTLDDPSIWSPFKNDFDLERISNSQKKTGKASVQTNSLVSYSQPQLSTVPIYTSCSAPNAFSLTFDDGPSAFSSDLDGLMGYAGSKASYFINGNNVGCIYDYADLLKQRFINGHLIGSHTWSHPVLTECSYETIHNELALLENAMIKILGVKPLYFRPPYGAYNDLVLQVLAERGYKGLILWNQDLKDSDSVPQGSPEMIEAFKTFPSQSISLSHETMKTTVAEVMPLAIPDLKSKGYNLISAAACLNQGTNSSEWYTYVQEPSTRDDSWRCS
ncbi:expressed protein [Phakopsora pachyrhizi]|uniref:Expressed protein n=1 Tax=Phakopsora pachyrhizi TaxID=170000 RepID=A0AAV0B1X6_PHAPC|nr:expressed protein [Phakopsora pachyrhizi]